MKRIYMSVSLATVALISLSIVSCMFAQNRQQVVATNAQPGQETNVRVVMTFPPRITKALNLSAEQEGQLQSVSAKFQDEIVNAEQDKRSAVRALQEAAMSETLNDGAVRQRKSELVAANARIVKANAAMLTEMRKVFTSEQLARLSPELPIERNGLQLIVQLPEALSLLNLTRDQESQLQAAVRGQEQKMVALSRKEKAARTAMQRAILGERYDEAAANQHLEELVAVGAEQSEINAGLLSELRRILTPEQLKRLQETNE
ncbi:MAG TPA: hypothetical protein VGC89_21630 [Pyrinomonadaceae bacterium]